MKRYLLLSMLSLVVLFALTACGDDARNLSVKTDITTNNGETAVFFTPEEINAAEDAIAEYVCAFNERDKNAAMAVLTDDHNSSNTILWEGEEALEINITSCDFNDPMRMSYLSGGRGSENGAALENVIVFRGDYIVTYPDNTQEAHDDWNFILVREDETSPWRLDDWGY